MKHHAFHIFRAIAVALLCMSSTPRAASQNVDKDKAQAIRGQVLQASDRTPMAGVVVRVDDMSALTDSLGCFAVRYSTRGTKLLVASFDGYQDAEAFVPSSDLDKNITILLYESTFASPEKRSDAYSITPAITIDDEIALRQAASVRATSRSATPGMGVDMLIRGYNSLNANTRPLFIVDGTPWESPSERTSVNEGFVINPLADIDVSDIESVEIVKDASSLYGSKGANGVIVIKTKRGTSSRTRINFDAMFGLNFRPSLPSTLNASQYRTYMSELLKGSSSASTTAKEFEGWLNPDPSELTYNKYNNNTDWNDVVLRTATQQRYGLNVQGGDDVARYAFSLGYTDAQGNVEGTDFSRLNTRINSDIKLFKNLSISAEIYYSQVNRELRDDGAVARTSPVYVAQIKSPFLNAYSYTTDGSALTTTLEDVDEFGVSNPQALIDNAIGKHKQSRFGISLYPKWNINSHWTLASRFSYSYDYMKEHYFSPMTGVSPIELEGRGTSNNTVRDNADSQNSLFSDTHLSFATSAGRRHQVAATVGYRAYINTYSQTIGEGHNTGDDQITNLSNSLDFRNVDGQDEEWNSSSIYGRADYTFDNRYTVWGAFALDASSRFGKDADDGFRMFGGTWGFFPSAGVEWNLLGERLFFNKGLDNLRLRASIGQTGNDDINGIQARSYLSAVNYLSNAVGLQIGNLANSTLQWETTTKVTAGFDIAFWKNRITATFDYFHHTTDNLLTLKKASGLSGLDTYLCNGGKLSNEGFEATLGVKAINGNSFKWNTVLALQHAVNKIKSLPDGDYETDIYGGTVLTAVGRSAGLFYGWKTQGVFSTTEEALEANLKKQNDDASYSTFAAGDVHFVDLNNDGIIDDDDRTVIGDPNPDLTGGWTNTFSYKRLTLDVFCTFSFGGDVYNYQRQLLESMSETHNQSASVLHRWTYEGQQTDMPKATLGDPMGNSRFSDRWIEDGSYLKIKNVRLSWYVPINNTYIEGLTLWASASNLYTFTRYLGSDPEVSAGSSVLYQGIDNGLLHSGRQFSIGLKLNL